MKTRTIIKTAAALAVACSALFGGCSSVPSIPLTDTGHGTYGCPNYWCQRTETDLCNTVAALTFIASHGDKRSKDIANSVLDEHWSLLEEMNKQQRKQATGGR